MSDGSSDDARPRGPRPGGLGDRWMAGEALPGVRFGMHARVRITEGPRAGVTGTVLLLIAVEPAPRYAVALDGAGAPVVKVAQGALAPLA